MELTLEDKNRHKFVVTGRRLVSRVLQYLQPWTKMDMDDVHKLEEDPVALEKALTKAA